MVCVFITIVDQFFTLLWFSTQFPTSDFVLRRMKNSAAAASRTETKNSSSKEASNLYVVLWSRPPSVYLNWMFQIYFMFRQNTSLRSVVHSSLRLKGLDDLNTLSLIHDPPSYMYLPSAIPLSLECL